MDHVGQDLFPSKMQAGVCPKMLGQKLRAEQTRTTAAVSVLRAMAVLVQPISNKTFRDGV